MTFYTLYHYNILYKPNISNKTISNFFFFLTTYLTFVGALVHISKSTFHYILVLLKRIPTYNPENDSKK